MTIKLLYRKYTMIPHCLDLDFLEHIHYTLITSTHSWSSIQAHCCFYRDRVRISRPPARERLNTSRDRSGSFSRERSLSRERSWSSDRLSARERSLSRDRPSSRERPSSANNSRFSNRSSSSYSNRNNYKPRSRTPSPAGNASWNSKTSS